jgi:hypothetical protein
MPITVKRSGGYLYLYKNGDKMASYNIKKQKMLGATRFFPDLKKEIRRRLRK